MSNFEILENPEYIDQIRKFETSDPANAELFNNVIQPLIGNDTFLKKTVDNMFQLIHEQIEKRLELLENGYIIFDWASIGTAENPVGWYNNEGHLMTNKALSVDPGGELYGFDKIIFEVGMPYVNCTIYELDSEGETSNAWVTSMSTEDDPTILKTIEIDLKGKSGVKYRIKLYNWGSTEFTDETMRPFKLYCCKDIGGGVHGSVQWEVGGVHGTVLWEGEPSNAVGTVYDLSDSIANYDYLMIEYYGLPSDVLMDIIVVDSLLSVCEQYPDCRHFYVCPWAEYYIGIQMTGPAQLTINETSLGPNGTLTGIFRIKGIKRGGSLQ